MLDFLLRGHNALGIEGSDFSLNMQRATWKHLSSKNLFTVDATKPYTIYDSKQSLFKADVISAWEFFEHIPENKIECVFDNISRIIKNDGIFIGSISTYPDEDNGIVYHHTVRPVDWWRDVFKNSGFVMIENSNFTVDDFCRGSGNGLLDWDVRKQPWYGFHFIAKKNQASL